MKEIHSPCENCTERCTACHDHCLKHHAYLKIQKEIKRRIREYMKKNNPYCFKPTLRKIAQSNK
ncbi:MAG: hypothetical protein E7508_06475 [Ruminococcus sp.]|nr:hypothetical protein [Ruminococcus sp.]